MKSVFKTGICLLLIIFLTNISAQNGDSSAVKKEGISANAGGSLTPSVSKQENKDTPKIKSSTVTVSGSRPNQQRNVYTITGRNSNPRIAELNREINQMVVKYKTNNVKAGKAVVKKFNELSSGEKENVRREADRYLFRRDKLFRKGDNKTKWDLIEKYYYEVYTQKRTSERRNFDPKKQQYEEIKRKISELFDLREDEKRDEIRKLEKQIRELEGKLNDRKRNKQQIVNGRLKELLGEPNNLKW